jgi:hypothetical protein
MLTNTDIILITRRGENMVNENLDKFNEIQLKHQGEYLGTDREQPPGLNDPRYNNQEITDKAIGATGRKQK